MTSGGFEYIIEIRDQFAKPIAEFQAAIAEAKKTVAALKKELGGLGDASKEAKAALGGNATEIKAATKAQEDYAAAIGKATAKQRAQMTEDQRVEDSLSKKIERRAHAARVEEQAAEQGISLSKKRVVAAKEEATVEDRVNAIIARRAELEETNAALRGRGFDPKGADTRQRVEEIIAARKDLQDTNTELRSRGVDAKGATTEARVNEILARRNELLAQNNLLEQRGFDPRGNALLSEKATIQKRINDIIARQAQLLAVNAGLKAQGFDPRGNALLSEAGTIQKRVNDIIARQNQLLAVNERLKRQGFDPRGNALLSEEATIQKRINDIIARQTKLRAINAGLKAQGLNPQGNKFLTSQEIGADQAAAKFRSLQIRKFRQEAERANPALAQLRRDLGLTESAANRISFTFRRLFGIMAAFTVARLAFAKLKEAIASSVAFNATIETSALGIASLVAATGQIRTATGRAADATEGWGLAQAEARRQLVLLRKDALTTAATFPELISAFQTAIGPGLSAGLNLDEVRKFASVISKAASALGVEQVQLAEEIRSILQGTITKRNTRIATSLGISNDDIARAKEMGVLFEFLETRFQAFNKASEDGAKTFTVLLSNAKDAISNLLGLSFTGLFNELKTFLTVINRSIVNIEDASINPALVKAFSAIGEVLSLAVSESTKIITTLSAGGAESTFEGIAIILKGAVILASDLIQGILKGARIAAAILSPIIAVARAIADVLGPTVNQILIWGVALTVAFKLVLASTIGLYGYLVKSVVQLGLMQLLSLGLARNISAADASVGKMTAGTFTLSTLWTAISAKIATAFTAVKAFLAVWGLTLLGVAAIVLEIKLLGDELERASGKTASLGALLKATIYGVGEVILFVGRTILDFFETSIRTVISHILSFQLSVGKLLSRLADIAGKIPGGEVAAALLKARIAQVSKAFEDFQTKVDATDGFSGFADRADENFTRVGQRTVDYYSELADGEAEAAARTNFWDNIPALISSSSREMESMVAGTQKLKDEITGANEELISGIATLRAQGAIQQQVKLITEARSRVEKESKVFLADRVQAERDLARAQKDRLEAEEKIAKATKEQRAQITNVLDVFQEIDRLRGQLGEAKSKQGLAKSLFDSGKGSLGEVSAANARVVELEELLAQTAEKGKGIGASKETEDLALALNDALRRREDAIRRNNEALENQKELSKEIFDLYETKIALVGALEFAESKKRQRETKIQFDAAKRLLGVSESRSPIDSALAQADNEVAAEREKLVLLQEQNLAQQNALRFVIERTKDTQLQVALTTQFTKLTAEGADAEALAAANVALALAGKRVIVRDQTDANRQAALATKAELGDMRAQIDAEGKLLEAKQKGTAFDQQRVELETQIALSKIKDKAIQDGFREEEQSLNIQLTATRDSDEQAKIEQQLTDLRSKSLLTLILQNIQIEKLKENLRQLGIQEQNRNRELSVSTAASRDQFDVEQGVDREAIQLTAVSNALKQEQTILDSILALHTASTEEIAAQIEKIRQLQIELDKTKEKIESPISSGLLDGMRRFVLEAPTMFEAASDIMLNTLKGITDVLADSLTGLFDPNNTKTLKERLGQLFLDIGNQIFKKIFERLIADLISKFSFSTSSSFIGPPEVAANSGGLIGANSGGQIPRYFASGGLRGSRKRHPKDTVPAFLTPGEFVIREPVVRGLGTEFFEGLNSMSLGNAGVRDIGKMGFSGPRVTPQRAAPAAAAQAQAAPLRAYLVPSEDSMEQLLAQGDGAMQRYLSERGYRPAWRS